MIAPSDVIPLLLTACPSFAADWRELEDENTDEKIAGGRLHYIDAAAFVRHLVRLRQGDDISECPAVFATLERMVTEGDEYVRTLAVIGYLEGMQMRTVTDAGIDPERDLRPFCGPVLDRWWDRINRFWGGDAGALRDGEDGPIDQA